MIRDYQKSDFATCSDLTNIVWDFDSHISSLALSELFQWMYTAGSLSNSNFCKVLELNGKVKGLLFGKIENMQTGQLRLSTFWLQLKLIVKLILMKEIPFKTKLSLFKMVHVHEVNRSKLESREISEVHLFIVDPEYQGMGWGKMLMNEFITACKKRNIKRFVLETDEESNYGFYEHFGFTRKGEFYSPLLYEYAGNSDVTYVYELYL